MDPELSAEGDLSQIEAGSETMIPVQHKLILLQFFLSKDDNLLLLVGGLLRSVFRCKNITPSLRGLAPELSLDIANKSEKGKELTEEERMMMPPGKVTD